MDADTAVSLQVQHGGVPYAEFTSRLSRERLPRRYLEVGVEHGVHFTGITAEIAVGVDPQFRIVAPITEGKRRVVLHSMTSDAFFADPGAVATLGGPIDLAFLDGMHHFEFLLRDFFNTEAISSPDAVVMLHDCLPLNAAMADRDPARALELSMKTPYPGYWTGDVWKLLPILKTYRPDLDLVCLDCPPTGLVCISRLDPSSRVLADNAAAIIAEFATLPNDWPRICDMLTGIKVTWSRELMDGGLQAAWPCDAA